MANERALDGVHIFAYRRRKGGARVDLLSLKRGMAPSPCITVVIALLPM